VSLPAHAWGRGRGTVYLVSLLRTRSLPVFSVLPTPPQLSLHLVDNRPFSAHDTRGAMLRVPRAQKLNTKKNVELVADQEVFGQHADKMTLKSRLVGY